MKKQVGKVVVPFIFALNAKPNLKFIVKSTIGKIDNFGKV